MTSQCDACCLLSSQRLPSYSLRWLSGSSGRGYPLTEHRWSSPGNRCLEVCQESAFLSLSGSFTMMFRSSDVNSHRVESSSIKLAWPLTAGNSKLAFKKNCQRLTLLQLFFSYPTPAHGFVFGDSKGNTPQAQTLTAFPFPASSPTCRPVSEQLRWGKMQCGSMVHWLVCVCVYVWFFQRHKLSTVTKAAEHVLTSKMQKKQSQSVRKQLFAKERSQNH